MLKTLEWSNIIYSTDSALLGIGPYCGESLDGRTFLTQGNSLRFEFKTDVSFALKGFQAKISFVPNTGKAKNYSIVT